MNFKTHCQMSKGSVEPAPLVDVVFLLLLFFLLSSPFVMQSGFGVLLPSSPAPPIASFQSLVVTVTRDNLLFFDNQPTTIDKLEQSLRESVQQGRGRELIIKADRQIALGTITEIWSIALRAGIMNVNVAARAEESMSGASH